jgi:hypothetical protein
MKRSLGDVVAADTVLDEVIMMVKENADVVMLPGLLPDLLMLMLGLFM